MLIERHFAAHGHVVHLGVQQSTTGWDVQEALDSAVVHVEHHDDWHRVERAIRLLEREARRHDSYARIADR